MRISEPTAGRRKFLVVFREKTRPGFLGQDGEPSGLDYLFFGRIDVAPVKNVSPGEFTGNLGSYPNVVRRRFRFPDLLRFGEVFRVELLQFLSIFVFFEKKMQLSASNVDRRISFPKKKALLGR